MVDSAHGLLMDGWTDGQMNGQTDRLTDSYFHNTTKLVLTTIEVISDLNLVEYDVRCGLVDMSMIFLTCFYTPYFQRD